MQKKNAVGPNTAIESALGVSGENFPVVFAMHTHDGTPTGGRQIYLPIFARDTSNGHTYRIDVTNGALTLTQLS